MLKRNKRGGNKAGGYVGKKSIHIFSGILKCGECGANMTATIDKLRVSGWRPSLYGCSTHRRNKNECTNKYITDVTLGPFVFNFIANIFRARGRIGERTTLKQLQRILLAGNAFSDVTDINEDALVQLKDMLLDGKDGLEYKTQAVTSPQSSSLTELEALRKRKQNYVTALGRLRSLYLFADSNMPEKDYIIERQKIQVDLEATERRIAELTAENANSIYDSAELMEQVGYFIMAQKLMGDDYIDYTKYISKVDPAIPKAFLKSVVKEIVVKDGEIASIEFYSGVKCEFYR